ncbi:MAG: cysteine desulfurase, partial [Pseudomonadota bacterium]
QTATLTPQQHQFAQANGFAQVHDIMQTRCAMCHAAEPLWPGMYWPPKGVVLEHPNDTARQAQQIYLQAGLSHAMPPGNISNLSQADRDVIIAWYTAAQ